MRVLSATLILSFQNLILFELVATDIEKEFEKLPLISIHESSDLNGIPSINIVFPNGHEDNLILEKHYASQGTIHKLR